MEPEVLSGDFTYRLAMESDWHMGAGTGIPGHIDRLVARDGDDLPFVPAKTLTGLWRDACERVAAGLDDGCADGIWQRRVAFLFGDEPGRTGGAVPNGAPPRPAGLSLRPARFPQRLRAHLAAAPTLRQAVTFRKPGVKINKENGIAEEKHLRVVEMARAGVTLEGSGHLDLAGLTDEERLAATFLLLAGARMLERLGGKRRRGSGRCRLTVVGYEDLDPYLDWAEALTEPPAPPAPGPRSEEEALLPAPVAATGETGDARQATDWWIVDLTVRADLPLLVAARTVGNTVESGDEIPGTLLLPIIRRTLAARGVDIHPWLVEGKLLVLQATPEVAGRRGLPVPQALFHEKEGGGFEHGRGILNRLREPEGKKQMKGYREGHIAPTGEGGWPDYTRTAKVFRTHNAVDDEAQGPVKHAGPGVYSYEAIAPGTVLRSELRLSGDVLAALGRADPDWWRRLEGRHRLGRSKKDDYGLVDVRAGKPRRIEPPHRKIRAGEELTVWLVSPVLLRGERLQPSALLEDLRRTLEQALETNLEARRSSAEAELLDSVLHPFRLDSWHAPWGLPRPSLLGIRAGGCAVFRVRKDIDPARLAAAEAAGIGERRVEGYGQVRFDDPSVTQEFGGREIPRRERETRAAEPEAQAPIAAEEGAELHEYARLLEKAAWRAWMERRTLEIAFTPGGPRNALGLEDEQPSMNQLGALRAVVRRLRSAEDRDFAAEWLKRLEGTPNRKNAWPQDALPRLKKLFADSNAIWEILKRDHDPPPVLTADGAAAVKRDLWAEAVQGLVEACCAARRKPTQGGPEDPDGGGGHGAAA